MGRWTCVDGNEAAAAVAHKLSEVIAIYPITPASPMGELADAWSAAGKPNLWGLVPEVVEMQSEAGAAGAVHGALQKGALATTFTSSQGLLLMLPNMFKMAGEFLPGVIHVAARTIATHALSIFGDHSDVMAARSTGFAMLSAASVQQAHDLALVAHAAALRSRVPFLHFFDGFRTSHEVNKIQQLDDAVLAGLIDDELVAEHRARGMSPDHPVLRGSAQNPDVFFQAREAANPYYDGLPTVVSDCLERLAELTGRRYGLVDYEGAPNAEEVIVLMGSGAGAAGEAVQSLLRQGRRVGMVTVHLFRPFPAAALLEALPATVRSVGVLDRTKEPGALGEPLYQDVITTLAEAVAHNRLQAMPRVIGGRYGLASKEFTPAMAASVFDELVDAQPKDRFTVGIVDDVTGLSLDYDKDFSTEDLTSTRAVFYGLGSDGTVSANKSSVKIVGEETDLHAQGYFVYDSKKSGSVTVSHLRFGTAPIRSTYLISRANFVACHQFGLLEKLPVLDVADHGATFLLNSPYRADEVWSHLPEVVRAQIVDKDLRFQVVNAYKIASEVGLGARINTVMQTCFFALTDIVDTERATTAIKASVEKTYGKLGTTVVERNFVAIYRAIEDLHAVEVPEDAEPMPVAPPAAQRALPDFVERVTMRLLAGEGDLLPVSALPVDGTFPTGTGRYEMRGIAQEIPLWDPDICIDCGHCAIVCPHAAIRMKVYDPEVLGAAPEGFRSKDFRSAEVKGKKLTIQVVPFDCTGCGVCVEVCPAKSKQEVKHKAIDMVPSAPLLDPEQACFEFFKEIPELDRTLMDPASIKGSQAREPLFEASGACAGCGETPYLKLLTQLFGDRLVIANATGCSSIYGGNLPTTPWSPNREGWGPAWANSLFEDNAEFGFGMRLAADRQAALARQLLEELAESIGEELARDILSADQDGDAEIDAQRRRITDLKVRLDHPTFASDSRAALLLSVADDLVERSVWIIGGDGWAYDIGSAGLDHVLASGRNVNVLVLDTEVYSNTGGQASKATPRAAVAKFASGGKRTPKKDLGMIAAQYGNVYVANVALGANYNQTIKALIEAEAHPGPSLVIAYSTCIAHGIDMTMSMNRMKEAVKSGYWPLYRYRPGTGEHERPLQLDSKAPTIPLSDFVAAEARFAMLQRSHPDEAARLLELAQEDVDERWRLYSQMAQVERTAPPDSDRDAREEE